MNDYDVITIGGATQDVFARCEGAQVIRQSGRSHENAWIGFDYGAKLPIDDLRFMVGGGATNTAASFSKLGLRTATVAKLGLDGAGDHVVAELTRQGIDTSLLCRAPGQTGYSIILTSYEGERSVLAYRGLNRELGIQDLDFARLGQTGWFFISSLSGTSADLLAPLLDFANTQGIKVALNPGRSQLTGGIEALKAQLAKVDLLFLNRQEAAEFVSEEPAIPRGQDGQNGQGHPVRPAEMYDLDHVFFRLGGLTRQAVIITDGRRGTQLWHQGKIWVMPVYPVVVADVLGAGDAFGAAFCASWIQATDPAAALKFASANAAGVVTIPGAHEGLLDRAGIAAMQERHSRIVPASYTLTWSPPRS